MNRVLPGLYVGNYRDSKDAVQLERHKITHIIAVHDAARRIYTDKEYLCIAAADTPNQNLSQYFPACNDFIHNARIHGGNVLIHCLAGMSRSVTIVVAYIISVTSLRWNEALKVVRGARAVSNPNSGFQKQLQDFENSNKLADERRRLVEKFHASSQLQQDEENCRRLLVAYNHLLLSKVICDGKCLPRICPTGTCRIHTASSRFCRQRSGESSPRGSTKSLDSSASDLTSGNWERHYGSHVRRPGSTPASPISLHRASTKSNRSESMLSISSMSSVASLPGQKAGENESHYLSIVDRNPILNSSQSCPNSPRRTLSPRKPGAKTQSPGSAIPPTDVTRRLEKERVLNLPADAPCSSSSSKSGEEIATSSSSAAIMGTPPESPCHRFMAHNSVRPAAVSPRSSRRLGRNTIRMAGTNITKWMMNRAYKFNLDKS